MYLAVWRAGGADDHAALPARGRVAALDAASGAALAVALLDDVPTLLALVRPPGQRPLLYCVAATLDPATAERDDLSAAALRWRLLVLDAVSLALEAAVPLDAPLFAVSVSPVDGALYALAGTVDVGARPVLVRVDAATLSVTRLAPLPGRAAALATAGDFVVIPHLDGHVAWLYDHHGRMRRSLAVGRRPIAVAFVPLLP